MSGPDTVVFAGPAHDRLITAAALLPTVDLGRYAVVGGLAIGARLGRAHRATADIDAVTDSTPDAVEVLVAVDGVRRDDRMSGRVWLGDLPIDTIPTEQLAPGDLDGHTDDDVLFLGGHRSALETASPLTLVGESAEATVPVALAGPLLAMKLHAILHRPQATQAKRAGDVWDVVRLVNDVGVATIASQLMEPVLRAAVARSVAAVMVDGAGRARRWLALGDPAMAAVTVDEVISAGTDLHDALVR